MTIDKYSLNARIYPMVLFFMPLIILGITYSIKFEAYIQILSTLGASAALIYFLANLGRDLGKKGEPNLWTKWGGMPTAQLLSYNNDRIDKITKRNYHERLCELSPIEKKPDFQSSELSSVIDIYRYWSKFLISKTRDTKKYSLLFKENISYGFRRNAWGLRNLAIILCVLSLSGNFLYSLLMTNQFEWKSLPISFVVSESLILVWMLIWIFVIRNSWVKVPAFAYGERLLESISTIK